MRWEIRMLWFCKSHAPRERVSWNEMKNLENRTDYVTLHVSVWVEIETTFANQVADASHAPRERVSWNRWYRRLCGRCIVTLHVSVWVEISLISSGHWAPSHAPRERVSWNWLAMALLHTVRVTLHVSVWVEILVSSYCFLNACESRSTWACELKSQKDESVLTVNSVTLHVSVWVEMTYGGALCRTIVSRSTWACELKCIISDNLIIADCHAPRERVSWNFRVSENLTPHSVTLHVSVWVEIVAGVARSAEEAVTLHVSVWVEIQ